MEGHLREFFRELVLLGMWMSPSQVKALSGTDIFRLRLQNHLPFNFRDVSVDWGVF
jgi:hypothetical protein